MAYGYFEDLTRRTTSDKILRDKSFDIAKNPKYDGYQRRLASMIFARSETIAMRDKSACGRGIKNENIPKKELAEEMHKPIIRKFERRRAHTSQYTRHL